jgi:hypothetical protein
MELKNLIIIALLLGLFIGGGVGYYIPLSNIATLSSELEDANQLIEEQENTIVGNTNLFSQYESEIINYENQILNLENEVSNLSSQIKILNSEIGELHTLEKTNLECIENFNNLSTFYLDLLQNYNDYQDYYESMWTNYNELLQAYYNLTLQVPEGNIIVTSLPGMVNGDFESGDEGWFLQGKGGIGWGGGHLHQYETFSTYLTQTINISSSRHGIAFSMQPQPLGGNISLRVTIDDTTVYEGSFSGINSNFNPTTIVIPFKYLFEMRKLYELESKGLFSLKFAVPIGPESGAKMIIDDVSLVSINYQPDEPYFEPAKVDFFDDFSFDTGYWEYQGIAFRDVANQYLVLNPAQRMNRGHIWLKTPVVSPFRVSFKYKAGNGERSGADGLALLFYQEKTISTPDYPDQTYNVVGAMLSGRFPTSGYGIEFDNYQNSIDNSGNHIALRNAETDHLTEIPFLGTEDFLWHDVYVEVGDSTVNVYVDGSLLINWSGQLDRSNFAFGFGAACGEDTNWAIIDDVIIEIIT